MSLDRARLATLGTFSVILATVAAHLRWAWLDGRAPRDLGLFFRDVPALYRSLSQPLGALRALSSALITEGGWYQVLLALGLALGGRDAFTVQVIDSASVALLLAAVALVARRLGGPGAGLRAVALGAAFPAIVMQGRSGWIHLPEASLVLLGLAAWLADPELERRRSVVALCVFGVLALALRPSALGWQGLLGLAVLTSVRDWRTRLILAGAWSLGAVPALIELIPYLGAKLEARAGYLDVVPDLFEQLAGTLSVLPGLLCLFGAFVLVLRRVAPGPGHPGVRLLLAYALFPILLFAGFRAGIDNFNTGAAAVAVLGALGLGAWPRAGGALAVVAWLLYLLPQFLPAPPRGPLVMLPMLLAIPAQPGLQNHFKPWPGFGAAQVVSLVEATCPDPSAPCVIGVDQGLFQPRSEDPGQWEIFLTGLEQVVLIDLRQRLPDDPHIHLVGMMRFDCGARDRDWTLRHPHSKQLADQMAARDELAVAWQSPIDHDCTASWWTVGGVVAAPERLPAVLPREEGP